MNVYITCRMNVCEHYLCMYVWMYIYIYIYNIYTQRYVMYLFWSAVMKDSEKQPPLAMSLAVSSFFILVAHASAYKYIHVDIHDI